MADVAIQFGPFQQVTPSFNNFSPTQAQGVAGFAPQQVSIQGILQMLAGLMQSFAALQQGWAGLQGGQRPQFAQPQFNGQQSSGPVNGNRQFVPQFAPQAPRFNPFAQRPQATGLVAPGQLGVPQQQVQSNNQQVQTNTQQVQGNNQTNQTGTQGSANSNDIQSVLAALKAIDDRPIGPITNTPGVAQFDEKEIEKGNLLAKLPPQLAQSVTAALLKKMSVKESFYGIPVGSIILPFKLSADPAEGSKQLIEYMQTGRQLLAAGGDNYSKIQDLPWISQLAALSGN